MSRNSLILLIAFGFTMTPAVVGQTKGGCADPSNRVACLITGIFSGANVASTNHQARFPTNDFSSSTVTDLNTNIATQLTALPIPSTASGFTYTLDEASGVYSRTAQSFGPILTERAETLGKHKFFIGFSYQRFTFNSIDGINLHNVGAVLKHQPDPTLPPNYLNDVITTVNNIDINVGQYTAIASYGLTNRVDVSIAVPILDVHFGVSSVDTIQRIGTGNDRDLMGNPIHFFPTSNGLPSGQETLAGSRTVNGMGDIVLRAKGAVKKWEHAGLAFGTDLRLPTGDEYNLLGSGAVGIRPFFALSTAYKRVAPHFDFGYQWNGKSILAGDPTTGYKRHLPSSFPYAAGVDVGVHKRLTLDFDILGQELINQSRIASKPFTAVNGAVFRDITFARENANITNGAVGFKLNPAGRVLLYFNVLFKLNDAGLRDNITPLFGITFTP